MKKCGPHSKKMSLKKLKTMVHFLKIIISKVFMISIKKSVNRLKWKVKYKIKRIFKSLVSNFLLKMEKLKLKGSRMR